MGDARMIRLSKFLSKHLRHQPEALGLTLRPGGWVGVDDLLRACASEGFPVDRPTLDAVVTSNDKKRFAFDPTGTLIRAQQGHSVEVDLELEAAEPPPVLFHGTGAGSVDAILAEGLRKMRRHHVHLSADAETARRVGSRHGRPVVLRIDAAAMSRDGLRFFRAGNGVWLVDSVEPRCLGRIWA